MKPHVGARWLNGHSKNCDWSALAAMWFHMSFWLVDSKKKQFFEMLIDGVYFSIKRLNARSFY